AKRGRGNSHLICAGLQVGKQIGAAFVGVHLAAKASGRVARLYLRPWHAGATRIGDVTHKRAVQGLSLDSRRDRRRSEDDGEKQGELYQTIPCHWKTSFRRHSVRLG